MEIKNARVLWQAVQGELQIIIPKPSYETWIKDTRALSFNGNILSIEVPNAFVAEMLEHRMHSMISDAAEKINGSQIEVVFSPVVLENSDMSDVNDKADILESSISNEKSLHLGKIKKFSVNYRHSFETFIVGKSTPTPLPLGYLNAEGLSFISTDVFIILTNSASSLAAITIKFGNVDKYVISNEPA